MRNGTAHSVLRRFEFRQGDLLGNIIEDYFDRHPAADFAVGYSEQVCDYPRAFVEFNFHDIVWDILFVAQKVGLMKYNPGIYPTAAA